MTLGLVVRFHQAEFGPALSTYIVAISDAARARGYSVLLLTDPDGVDAVRRAISGRQVDGLILMNLVEDDPRLEAIASSGFSCRAGPRFSFLNQARLSTPSIEDAGR